MLWLVESITPVAEIYPDIDELIENNFLFSNDFAGIFCKALRHKFDGFGSFFSWTFDFFVRGKVVPSVVLCLGPA